MRYGTGLLVAVLACLFCAAFPLSAAEPEPTIVLDTRGFWRMHYTLKPPVLDLDDGLKPALMTQPWLNHETAEPPAGWAQPSFDDSAWLRGPAGTPCRTSYLSRLCMRGKFRVADPAKVKGLSLSVDYHGGVILTVNGTEIGRGHIPAAARLAEGYPEEAFVTEKGTLLVKEGYYLPEGGRAGEPTAESVRRMGLRVRTLRDVAVPSRLLREGVNVVAIEIIRAPYHSVLDKMGWVHTKGSGGRSHFDWNTCEVRGVRLTATGADGLVPNATRPEGLQVWNSNPLAADYDMDFGDPCEPLQPIYLVGARGGLYSGKVVLGSTEPIRGLHASTGDLKAVDGTATIPASAVRVRYGLPWGRQAGLSGRYYANPYPRGATMLEAIADAPPDEIPVPEKRVWTAEKRIRPVPVLGAVVPVWVTVKVPADAPQGTYTGRVRLTAAAEQPVDVPIRLKVVDWTLPDPQDYCTWVDMIQSPDTLAVEYGLDLWSEEHWKLIARSMELLGEVGNGTLYVPLIAHTNLGNAQTMVRWIDKGDGRYEYDFSIMEKYLDLARRHMGKPRLIVLNVWDLYLIPQGDGISDAEARRTGKNILHARMAANLEAHKGSYGLGPLVTVLDEATGKTDEQYLPRYEEAPSKDLWAPLFKELRTRMVRRGLEDALILGMLTDARPSKSDTAFFKDIAAGIPWMGQSHYAFPAGKLLHDLTPVTYYAHVWGVRFADSTPYKFYKPVEGRMYGWKNGQEAERRALFERFTRTDSFPATKWRETGEYTISGDRCGIGRLGADFWSVVKDREGRRRGRIPARYPEAHWRNLNICTSLLAPGPRGPASTNRFEMFREGIQECEARITIEAALTDDALRAKLGADLARRCQETLDLRLTLMWKGLSSLQLNGHEFGYGTAWRWTVGVAGHYWFVGSGWQERSEQLYALAGEVERALR